MGMPMNAVVAARRVERTERGSGQPSNAPPLAPAAQHREACAAAAHVGLRLDGPAREPAHAGGRPHLPPPSRARPLQVQAGREGVDT